VQWHRHYDSAGSSLSQRLGVVQRDLRRALSEAPRDADGSRRLISICAGEGRDVLPVLADEPGGPQVRALLVELDPELAQRARDTAAELGLSQVRVSTADAGAADTWLGAEPAHIVLACGIFGNVSATDVLTTIDALPALLVAGGIVLWTRGRGSDPDDPSLPIRDAFAARGFRELAFTRPDDASYRVGMHRADETQVRALQPGTRLFTFG
jgi:hypothetical protein